jgi:hypothetical protein
VDYDALVTCFGYQYEYSFLIFTEMSRFRSSLLSLRLNSGNRSYRFLYNS